jgi:acyl-CoA thioester hydrolase
MTHPALAGCPVILTQDVAWGHMDSFGHVNNVVYFHYFENARVEWLTRVGWFALKESNGMGPIVASTAAKFRKPLTYPDRIHVGVKVSDILADRVTVEHILVSEKWDAVAAEGPAVVVNYDYRKLAKAELPMELVNAIRSSNS